MVHPPTSDETSADELARSTGWSLVGFGALAVLVGLILPFFVAADDPTGPFVGLEGLVGGGGIFVVVGAVLLLSNPRAGDNA